MESSTGANNYLAFPHCLPAQQSRPCFSFLLGCLYLGVLEQKKGEARGPGTANLGHDAGGFPSHGLPHTDTLQKHCRHESSAAELLWRPNGWTLAQGQS